jgi:hypothetical protein
VDITCQCGHDLDEHPAVRSNGNGFWRFDLPCARCKCKQFQLLNDKYEANP